MERIDAAPLATRVGARVDPVWLARAAVATLRALARVHEASDERGALDVVHGDVSPANILVHEDASRAVMVDFGLARWRDASPDARGEGVAFGGTLLYAAPEVARGERIDARADLFSMALSFFHVASGASPRRVALPTPALLVDAGERSVDSWLRDARSSIALDPDLERALVACASFDPARRPASAREALVRAAC